jgi:hypothetical protein
MPVPNKPLDCKSLLAEIMISCIWLRHRHAFWCEAWDFGCLPALVDHENAFEGDDDLAILVVAGGLDRHNADVRP